MLADIVLGQGARLLERRDEGWMEWGVVPVPSISSTRELFKSRKWTYRDVPQ